MSASSKFHSFDCIFGEDPLATVAAAAAVANGAAVAAALAATVAVADGSGGSGDADSMRFGFASRELPEGGGTTSTCCT
eukprot:SAG31_NODE_28562_length_408_cov_0.834951_1_plen_78_part_10